MPDFNRIITIDAQGWKRAVLALPTDKPENGLPSMPPDINLIDWDAVKREIHNLLVEQGILTWTDWQAQGSPSAFTNPLRRALVNLYKGE